VISDLDIWRAANLLIRHHGDLADVEACRRADLMLDRGDRDGQLVWLKITRAIAELLATIEGWVDISPETPEDRTIREEGERIRRAFPGIDFDHPGAGTVRIDRDAS
jgi:hypothetical protein